MTRRMTKKHPPEFEEDDTLSLPDFHFVEFAGLDGFDLSTCRWSPVDFNCDNYYYCSDANRHDYNDEDDVIYEPEEYKSFNHHNNVRSKKTVSEACCCAYDEPEESNQKRLVRLPRIPGVKKNSVDNNNNNNNNNRIQRKRGRQQRLLVDEDQSCMSQKSGDVEDDNDDMNFQLSLDRLRIFGGEHEKNLINLPSLNNTVRRSTSLPCRNSCESKNKNNNNRRKRNVYKSGHNPIPWQGPNSNGIYSKLSHENNSCNTSSNPRIRTMRRWKFDADDGLINGQKVRRCGGGGFANPKIIFPFSQSSSGITVSRKSATNKTTMSTSHKQQPVIIRGTKSNRGVNWR